MPTRFRVSPAAGAIGIYSVPTENSTDDAPLTDPLGNLSRVFFHPALRYPGVVTTLTGSLSLPAGLATNPYLRRATYTLGAHGQTGKPMILGKLLGLGPSGTDVAWAGSIPVQQSTISGFGGTSQVRWLILGADDTNIVVHEIARGTAANLPALTLSYEIMILDRNLSAALPDSGPLRFRATGSAVEMQTPKGSFSSAKRYLKKVTSAGFLLPGGQTLTQHFTGAPYQAVTWRLNHGPTGYAKSQDSVDTGVVDPAPTPTPRVEQVSL